MPSCSSVRRVPSYRRHRPTGQAVVTIDGRDIYLGKWGVEASRREYDRLIGEWLAGGRMLGPCGGGAGLTVAEVALRFWRFAQSYYRKGGRPTQEVAEYRIVLRLLRESYGHTAAADFGPVALKALRQRMVDADLCRGVVNQRTNRIKRIFKWAVAEELIPPSVDHGLSALDGLRRGRTTVRESEPVRPVADDVVDATLPTLPEVVADMVRLQRLTGCRPAEVCIVRPTDVDTSGEVWLYRPESHKTEHHDKQRVIAIGPRGQDVLRKYLLRPEGNYCFSPTESEKKRRAVQHEARKTPLSCGNRPGTNRTRRPKRSAGNQYDTDSYRRAIHRAVEKVNRTRAKEAAARGEDPVLLPRWSPNRLRHSAATEIRRQFGLEGAQVALGHAHAAVTEVYAERDLSLAVKIMREVG